MIFSHEKTKYPADIIIDDKPTLTFEKTDIKFKYWVIVDHDYNEVLPDTQYPPIHRLKKDWSNWSEIAKALKLV